MHILGTFGFQLLTLLLLESEFLCYRCKISNFSWYFSSFTWSKSAACLSTYEFSFLVFYDFAFPCYDYELWHELLGTSIIERECCIFLLVGHLCSCFLFFLNLYSNLSIFLKKISLSLSFFYFLFFFKPFRLISHGTLYFFFTKR